MVSAWATANSISLGQVVTDEKSNEITAIPKLLKMLALKGKKTAGTCRRLLKQEPSLWTFVWIAGIEPTNNDAERAVRHAVLCRRSSGGADNEAGSRLVERMLSVVATARQQNRTVVELLTACRTPRLAGSAVPSLLPTAAARAAA